MLRRSEKGKYGKKRSEVRTGAYLFESVRYLCLVADVTRVKGCVMMALNNVKDGYWVAACKQSFYDVSTEETAAANDEESVALPCGGHHASLS